MSETWVTWMLAQPPSAIFVEVDHNFLVSESMNPDIQKAVNNFEKARTVLLGKRTEKIDPVERDALDIYGLVHARYLLTEAGMQKMIKKRNQGKFPKCPRLLCKKCTCVPVGIDKDTTVKMFCPNCTDVYDCKDYELEGRYFGKEWVHMLMKKHPEIVENERAEMYEPRVYGYRVYLGKPK